MRPVVRRTAAPVLYTIVQVAVWVILLPWMIISQQDADISMWRPFPLVAVGGMFLAAGVVIVLQAGIRLAEAGSPVFGMRTPDLLVTDGWYGLVRNPQDVGTLLLSVAPALALNSRVAWSLPVIVLAYHAIGVGLLEDYFLLRAFGEDFEQYRRSVRKWVPRGSG